MHVPIPKCGAAGIRNTLLFLWGQGCPASSMTEYFFISDWKLNERWSSLPASPSLWKQLPLQISAQSLPAIGSLIMAWVEFPLPVTRHWQPANGCRCIVKEPAIGANYPWLCFTFRRRQLNLNGLYLYLLIENLWTTVMLSCKLQGLYVQKVTIIL